MYVWRLLISYVKLIILNYDPWDWTKVTSLYCYINNLGQSVILIMRWPYFQGDHQALTVLNSLTVCNKQGWL